MASYGQSGHAAIPRPGQGITYGAPMHAPPPGAPAGTFAPGTKIQVGSHRVVIQKYLSEGGFAHVYLVKLPKPVDGTDLAVLKRVAVPDKEALRGMRIEVETMKRLKGHRPIVTYIDSHASELRGGGYEVFLLMEYCNGGGLIDFMNTRLQHRLTEPEILQIFTDVAEGVACMHYLKPPLLHRDLKVENVLITATGSTRKFKLCDFGSAASPKPAPTTVVECRLMDEDVQKHTTMQYRSPEMIDVYRKQAIDEKSDIWALGVLLYKLCYYTTPFEEQGQLAILNASYKFPSYPAFSDRLKKLIASMLRESPQQRPNIYQVLREACSMQGRDVPVKDIYAGRPQSESRANDKPPTADKPRASPVVGAVFSPPAQQQPVIPDVVPMRRGRPPAGSQPAPQAAKPSPSPMRVTDGDPFAALDAKFSTKGGDADELSSRFPTLDQFSILHQKGTKFDFDSPTSPPTQNTKDLNQRVTEKLADEAFASSQPVPATGTTSNRQSVELTRGKPYTSSSPERQAVPPPIKSASAPPKPSEMSRASAIIKNSPALQVISSGASQVYQPTPTKPTMVSTGTMTSTPPPERPSSQYQIYRFPASDHHRSSSLPRQQETAVIGGSRAETPTLRPSAASRGPSFPSQATHVRQPSSSRPSLEGSRPSMEFLEPMSKSRSIGGRPRPASTHLESNMDYLRERENSSKPLPSPGLPSPRFPEKAPSPALQPEDETNIESNVDFLRSMEDSDPKKSKHGKRSSLNALSGKGILGGKFGDAFKRFEANTGTSAAPPRTPSPLKDLERRDLTPIAGSEATDGRSDDGQVLEETDDMTPEMRREIERRRLSQEEKRVAAAAAEYRQRVAQREQGGFASTTVPSTGSTPLPKSIGGVSRAVSIQNKVQSLLSETSTTNVKRTAEGYGHYSDAAAASSRPADGRPDIPRKPIAGGRVPAPTSRPVPGSNSVDVSVRRVATIATNAADARPPPPPKDSKPAAPPKPIHLNRNLTSSSMPSGGRSGSPPKPSGIPPAIRNPPRGEQLVAADLPGQPGLDMTRQEKDDYIRDFTKRFPSLTSIEMVERDLAAEADGRSGR